MRKLLFLLVLGLVLVGCGSNGKFHGIQATLYKSPTCGCCVGYGAFLEQQGFDVEVVQMEDMIQVRKRYNIPNSVGSCHTTVIGDYFIEGHVPLEGLEKLLDERPKISGIALPNMPSGTPGMPGIKRAPYHIYSLTNGVIGDFMII